MTVSASVEVKNKLGIHARPAMMLFELVKGFDAHVLLRNEDGIEADADSVIGLLMLDSAQGKQVEVQVEGPEEVEALAAVVALFTSGFNEE
jgi:phosphocarrier protein NPr